MAAQSKDAPSRVDTPPGGAKGRQGGDKLARAAFVLGAALLAFLYGYASRTFQLPPHHILDGAIRSAAAPAAAPKGALPHSSPARYDLEGAHQRRPDPKGRAESVVLVTSHFPQGDPKKLSGWRSGVRLLDDRGEPVHEWVVDPSVLWKDWPYSDGMGRFNQRLNYVHGAHLRDDGDLVVSVEYVGMVRLDPAGKVVWRLDHRTHHSVHPTGDGGYWACGARYITDQAEVDQRFPGLTVPLVEDLALQVSESGELQRTISVLEALYQSPRKAMLWKVHQPVVADPSTAGPLQGDVIHLNDVEPLPPELAPAFPMFAPGDLLVSLRNIHTIAVLDGATGAVKWSWSGSLIRQHDPDWLPDGSISVYDNHSDGTPDGSRLGRSRLIAIHPGTGATRRIYPLPATAAGERPFHSRLGGKAQRLPNGNWMIAEATAGRVFEVDSEGRTLWEWGQQRHAEGRMIGEVMEGTRYFISPATVRGWKR